MSHSNLITVDFVERSFEDESDTAPGWKVSYKGKYADGLGYDEMLGLIAAITLPKERPTLSWLKTKEEHAAWRNQFKKANHE